MTRFMFPRIPTTLLPDLHSTQFITAACPVSCKFELCYNNSQFLYGYDIGRNDKLEVKPSAIKN